MFSREYYEIFKNTYFEEHLRVAASVTIYLLINTWETIPSRQGLQIVWLIEENQQFHLKYGSYLTS